MIDVHIDYDDTINNHQIYKSKALLIACVLSHIKPTGRNVQ